MCSNCHFSVDTIHILFPAFWIVPCGASKLLYILTSYLCRTRVVCIDKSLKHFCNAISSLCQHLDGSVLSFNIFPPSHPALESVYAYYLIIWLQHLECLSTWLGREIFSKTPFFPSNFQSASVDHLLCSCKWLLIYMQTGGFLDSTELPRINVPIQIKRDWQSRYYYLYSSSTYRFHPRWRHTMLDMLVHVVGACLHHRSGTFVDIHKVKPTF